jgi:hypothetical protein
VRFVEKIPLQEGDEELEMLFEWVDVMAAEQRRLGRPLTRSEKRDFSGRTTENIVRKHLRDKKLNISKSRVYINQSKIHDEEIDLLLLRCVCGETAL